MKRAMLFVLIALLSIWCSQCGDSTEVETAEFDLTMNFTGMEPEAGKTMMLQVLRVDSTDSIVVADTTIASVPDSAFSLVLHNVLDLDRDYAVDFFVDENNNGRYDVPPTDHAWRVPVNDVVGDTVVNFARTATFTDINFPQPALYNLTVQVRGMDTLVGQEFRVSVVDTLTGTTVAETTFAALDTANFDVVFDTALVAHRTYNVDLFGDLNGNGTVQPPPTDESWRVLVANVTSNRTVTVQHSAAMTDLLAFSIDRRETGFDLLALASRVNKFLGRPLTAVSAGIRGL